MSIKERPLIKAVEKLGPLPGFFFANMYAAGFFAVIGCVFFAAFAMTFVGATFGGNDTLAIFQAVHGAAWFGLVFGFIVLLVAATREVNGDEEADTEEKAERIKFIRGGLAGVAFFAVADLTSYGAMERFFEEFGPIACFEEIAACR